MAARKTPEERALADVEKAIKVSTGAAEKADAAQKKADELTAAANRAEREVRWMANHPDIPDDFDLDEFRRSLEAPFSDEDAAEHEATMRPVPKDDDAFGEETDLAKVIEQKGEIVKELVANPEEDADNSPMPETSANAIDAADDDDDPWSADS